MHSIEDAFYHRIKLQISIPYLCCLTTKTQASKHCHGTQYMTQCDCDILLNHQLLDHQGSSVAHQAMDDQRPRPKLRAIPSYSSMVDHRPVVWNMVSDGALDKWSLMVNQALQHQAGPLSGGLPETMFHSAEQWFIRFQSDRIFNRPEMAPGSWTRNRAGQLRAERAAQLDLRQWMTLVAPSVGSLWRIYFLR